MTTLVVLTAAVAEAGAALDAAARRTVVYEGIPIDINVPLHQEIRVHMHESVEVGVPVTLTSKLDVTSVHGIVYLTAVQAFTSHRLALKSSPSGRIVLLDVSSTTDGSVFKDIFIATGGSAVTPEDPPLLTASQLMRYIAQMSVAPRTSRTGPTRIKRVALGIPRDSVYRDFEVGSTLLAAWRTERWLALAVELHNQSDETISLDPNDVAGVWRTVGLLHTRLLPRDKRGAQTVMFLVGAHDAIADLQQ